MSQITFASNATPSLVNLDANFTELYNGVLIASGNPIGYATGAGGAVTQATSKSTGVTLSKVTGQVTMNNAALAASTAVAFVVSNALVAATDTILPNIVSGPASATSYIVSVGSVSAGAFSLVLRNMTAGSLSEAVVVGFAVIKAVIS